MRIEVEHETVYEYTEPVRLGPQTVRLRPRPGGALREVRYELDVDPAPSLRLECLDATGNRVVRLRFEGQTRHLRLVSRLAVDTGGARDYVPALESDGARFPIAYCAGESEPLAPYLAGPPPDMPVADLTARLQAQANGDPLAFLDLLNRWIYEGIAREIRPTGAPQCAAETLARGSGACRDQTVLFVALCRAAGLAARFVSGYQDRSAMETDRRYLHAWPEVFLPGAGWYGYDPTRGIPVSDGHVPLAAGAGPGRNPAGGRELFRGCGVADGIRAVDSGGRTRAEHLNRAGGASPRREARVGDRSVCDRSNGSGAEPAPDVRQMSSTHR